MSSKAVEAPDPFDDDTAVIDDPGRSMDELDEVVSRSPLPLPEARPRLDGPHSSLFGRDASSRSPGWRLSLFIALLLLALGFLLWTR